MVPDPLNRWFYFSMQYHLRLSQKIEKIMNKMITNLLESYQIQYKYFRDKLKNLKDLKIDCIKYSLVSKAKRQVIQNIHTAKCFNKQNHCKRGYFKRMNFHMR
ncbi:hypothetical protein SteCoe_29473 [Stentor coeruleus]|uniref:Uncharacterized protein n=1 Tax=Stentor coeruleus TaxID=5963 RepID=A0A1R2B699_9CILI|nr:hypothetical protein SteCoe_29473 [Stentor coeruleus]